MGATRTAIILCCILLMMPFANARSIEPSEWDGWAVVEGGYSILVEEYTATWCPRCAEIDPDLSMVAEEHGKRIAMVSYHPDDGIDAFGPEAAQHRLQRLENQHNNTPGYPAFVVNNGLIREDVSSWPDVTGDILRAESNQRAYTKLTVTAQTNETHLTVTVMPPKVNEIVNGTQYTILFVEHKKMVPEGFDNPGEKHRDRVLVGLAEFPMDGEMLAIDAVIEAPFVASYPIQNMEEWSVIVVHEYTEEALENREIMNSQPLGVVELAVQSSAFEEGTELPVILPVMVFLAVGILGLFTLQSKEKVREEE
ncbi:MAG: thioredoxin family protein [Candidatus Thermoplasmatota archaeon]|nr:thioredoxin family protein [Candidatus Thermoplasmatota archaeon]MEC8589296.1 thioredoxin family protein [Candidatus Thermoplasmatota archaeon]